MSSDREDVFRFDVAVNDAVLVRVVQSVGDFARDADGTVDGELALALNALTERLAFHERHREVQSAVDGAGVEDAENVRMLQARSKHDLALEALGAVVGRYFVVQDIEGDRAVVPDVMREVGDRESTAAEFAIDAIAVEQCGLQSCALRPAESAGEDVVTPRTVELAVQ